MEVEVRNNNVTKAMRILKKKIEREGILQEVREREFYEKPSERKRREKKQNIRRHKKAQRERMREDNLY
jgi:small subunit ribosomal protein S21